MSELLIWTILLVPIGAFGLIALIVRPFFNRYHRISGIVSVLAIAYSFVLSINLLQNMLVNSSDMANLTGITWFQIGSFEIKFGLLINELTSIMLIVVTGISLLVQIYSIGYMSHDSGFSRYFSFISLFTASMIGLVIASNVIQMYFFWELVGLCSYLLIGFWHHKPEATAAAKKAFIVTRIGDFGFLIAILYLFFQGVGLEISDINHWATSQKAITVGAMGLSVGGWVALGIFSGAVGKSAQFPLHVWLPDAMEGPTPVSALIHAATMVAAGIFLVGRFDELFKASNHVVAIIGGFTAFFAASMAIVSKDIKKVLAFSTISQLGYMMAALGIGAYSAAIFHLFTHAFFKALLFLSAGNVGHSIGTFNMHYMGGLRTKMPITFWSCLIGSISLIGIFPFAGFWSKDEILANAYNGFIDGNLIISITFILLAISVLLTGFYATRMILMTFFGKFKGGISVENADISQSKAVSETHPHESSLIMIIPIIFLAFLSIIIGFLANPPVDIFGIPKHWLTEFLEHGKTHASFNILIAISSMILGLIGAFLAFIFHRGVSKIFVLDKIKPVYTLLERRYYLDVLYERYLVDSLIYKFLGGVLEWIDRELIDRTWDLCALLVASFGQVIRKVQTGQVSIYGLSIPFVIVVIMISYYIWGSVP